MDKAALLAEIVELTSLPAEAGEDEITVREYAQAANCNTHTAQKRLDDLVTAGVMARRAATTGGRPCWAYRKVIV